MRRCILCLLTFSIGAVNSLNYHEVCNDPEVRLLIDVQNSCTSANSTCNMMIPVSPVNLNVHQV